MALRDFPRSANKQSPARLSRAQSQRWHQPKRQAAPADGRRQVSYGLRHEVFLERSSAAQAPGILDKRQLSLVLFTHRGMCPSRAQTKAPAQAGRHLARVSAALAELLRAERIRRGWTLRELAGRAGLSVAAVHHADQGNRRASTPTVDSQRPSPSPGVRAAGRSGAATRSRSGLRRPCTCGNG